MLRFERALVATLITTEDDRRRADIESFVARSVGAMPEFLRLGVLAESVGFSLLATVARARDGRALARFVRTLEASPVSLVRQYVRLFRSLVLFAEQESEPAT